MHRDYTEAEQEHFEERAAIAEYLAEFPRVIAESEATRAVGYARWLKGELASAKWMQPPGARESPDEAGLPAGFQ